MMQNISMSRIDIIGHNGGDGMHYEMIPPCYKHFPKDDNNQKLINGCIDCIWLLTCFVPKDADDNTFCTP